MLPAGAEETPTSEIAPADLRANAPEGTFLEAGAEPLITEDSYKDGDISIKITRYRDEESRSNITIADIYLSNVTYLRRGFALGKWKGEMRSIKTIAADSNAILALTGDYSSLLDAGLVVANGDVLRDSDNGVRENCLILLDGQMLTYKRREMEVQDVINSGIWHSFLFGPALLDGGQAIGEFDSKIRQTNPRTALGYYEPGHYSFVVVDGRSSKSRGMTLEQLSRFMLELGCKTAYNLDGGQSAMLWFNGEVVNEPYRGGRRLTDIVFIGRE